MKPHQQSEAVITAVLCLLLMLAVTALAFYYIGKVQGARDTMQQVYDAKEMDKARERNGR